MPSISTAADVNRVELAAYKPIANLPGGLCDTWFGCRAIL